MPKVDQGPLLTALEPVIDVAEAVGRNTQSWVDETGTAHVGIRSLHGDSYSLFTLGARVRKLSPSHFAAGYGLGRQLRYKNLFATLDALTQLRIAADFDLEKTSLIVRLRAGMGLRLSERFSLFGGLAFKNIRSSQCHSLPNSQLIQQAEANKIWRDEWPGFFIGLQF
ncbi:MAG: hypothetical protein ACOC41_05180 [Chitinivibrionales bacterium]